MLNVIKGDRPPPEPPQSTVACAFSGCETPARFYVQRPRAGHINVCRHHHEKLAQDDADGWCKEHGINNAAEARAQLRWKRATIGTHEAGVDWARKILERLDAEENVPQLSVQFALEALREPRPQTRREPGQDESEREMDRVT